MRQARAQLEPQLERQLGEQPQWRLLSCPLQAPHQAHRPPRRHPSALRASRSPALPAAWAASALSARAPLGPTPMSTPRTVRRASIQLCRLADPLPQGCHGGAKEGRRSSGMSCGRGRGTVFERCGHRKAWIALDLLSIHCWAGPRDEGEQALECLSMHTRAGIAVCSHGATSACDTCQAGWQGANCDACMTNQVCAASLDDSSATCNTGLLYTKWVPVLSCQFLCDRVGSWVLET